MEARAERDGLKKELDAVRFAAHMPEDYQYGLASWINQRLYAAWIGAMFSPDVMKKIEDGTLTFPNAPVYKERDAAQAEVNRLWNLLGTARASAEEHRARYDSNGGLDYWRGRRDEAGYFRDLMDTMRAQQPQTKTEVTP